MSKEENIEVLEEKEQEKGTKKKEKVLKNNSIFYFLIMIAFTFILIKTLNVRIVNYGIKNNTTIPSCTEKAIQFNYHKEEKHWIGIGAITLGMIISYINIISSIRSERYKVITYITIFLGTILILGTALLIKNDIEFENKIQTSQSNVETNCKE
ncbi:MAG: hypothetical protein IKE70_01495 [Bacilli bacterium]|nr:hypothetical protein [Bacilli bacterium]